MISGRILWGDGTLEVKDLHYGRTMAGVELLYTGTWEPGMLDKWVARKDGPPPVLFERDFASVADWRRTLAAALRADVEAAAEDRKMAYKPPPVESVDGDGTASEVMRKGRADRQVKAPAQ